MYREIFNTDAEIFGGSNLGNSGAVNGRTDSRTRKDRLTLPPLAVVIFKP